MIPLTPVDLSSATVGGTGTISFAQAQPSASPHLAGNAARWATLQVFNESGCGLLISFPGTGQGARIPAGRWGNLPIPPGVDTATYTVLYIVPGGLVSLLLADYYGPGEQVPSAGALGNSPTGVGGSVTTSGSGGTAFIKNDGNAPATSIIESTPNDQASSATSINNDGSGFWRVLSANVLRTIVNVVRGNNTSGKATVSIGDSGDTSITTFYGTVGAGSVVPGATVTGTVPSATTATTATTANALATNGTANNPTVNGGNLNLDNGSATSPAAIWNDPTHTSRAYFQLVNELLTLFTTYRGGANVQAFQLRAQDSAAFFGGTVQVPAVSFAGGSYGGTLSGVSFFSGTGPGTFTHGLSSTPRWVGITTTQAASSETVGVDTIGATTCRVNMPNSWPWIGVALA